jgi:tripartite-type tricarboxylate transporter receptor subunit TctC
MKRRHLLQAAAVAAMLPRFAFAQTYPAKPIRYIVPVAAGGGNDMIARVVTERWGKAIGQTFVVENQGGGGGVIASVATARAAPDGYTLMQGYVATHGTTPATRRVPYDAIRDFTPIGMIGGTPNALVVNAAVPAKTLAEFIDYAKKNPGKLTYGSAGLGSATHLNMELFKSMAGVDILHVPYKGSTQARQDVLSGQVNLAMDGLLPVQPLIKDGRLRALALTSSRRAQSNPEIPTIAEAGVPGYASDTWYGLLAPAKTPKEIIAKLQHAAVKGLHSPEVRERFAKLGAEAVGNTPEEFARLLAQEQKTWTRVVKDSGAKAE